MKTFRNKEVPEGREYLFTKSGKAKKQYCHCLSREQRAMFKRLYGREIIQCAGNSCPYYGIDCGRANIEEYERQRKQLKKEG